jgi:hypothetical protein
MAFQTRMVTYAPGQVGFAGGAAGAEAAGEPDATGRGGGRSQIGARTHMSMTYSSRFQQVTWPSSIGAQVPSVRGRHPASRRDVSYCAWVSSGARCDAQVRCR